MKDLRQLKDSGQSVIALLEKDNALKDAVDHYNPPKEFLVEFFFTEIAIAFNAGLTPENAASDIYTEFIKVAQTVRGTV